MRNLIGDKGYGADRLRRSLGDAGAIPVTKGRRNRERIIRCDQQRCKDRPLIENALCRRKGFRRVQTVTTSSSPASSQALPAPQ